MSDLIPSVSVVNGRPTATSMQVAEHFGKEHKHVLRDIENLLTQVAEISNKPNFELTEYEVTAGFGIRKDPMYRMDKDAFILLVMSYTGKKALQIKLAYIAAFNAMEEQLAGRPQKPALPATITPSKPTDRKVLRALVYAWSQAAGIHVSVAWPQVRAYFQLDRIDDLPVEWIPDALDFVQAKIDSLTKRLPTPEPTVAQTDDLPIRHARHYYVIGRLDDILPLNRR